MGKQISISALRELLHYDSETGVLRWRMRGVKWFSDGKRPASLKCKAWNARFSGNPAFTASSGDHKDLRGSILGKNYVAHRVAWAIYYGAWPEGEIDHINGDPSDNRIVNLRDVSHAENTRNVRRRITNTSGHVGVYWDKKVQKWRSQGTFNSEYYFLGHYCSKDDAIVARQVFERDHGFHENHGREQVSSGNSHATS